MRNVYLFQPSHHTIFDQTESHWLPYSIGCLWSYAQQFSDITDNYKLAGLMFKRTAIDQLIDSLDNPSVAAFSCYAWNYEYNRATARAIKEQWPNCVIVFGGPQVTKRPIENSFFKKNPYVDVIVNGEGEVGFVEILRDIANGKTPKKINTFTRMDNLDYPSPYTSGVFDDIIKAHPEYTWQVVLETNRGCPYACTFCDWGSLTYSKILKFNEQRVLDEINWFSNNRVSYVFIADANFGILYERDKKFAQVINQLQLTKGWPKVVMAQWAKNAKSRILEIAKIFFNGSNRGFTVSVQSMNEVVLDAVKRKNMDINDLTGMLKECARLDIPAYTELILGLPHETYATWKDNHDLILECGQHQNIDVWFAQALENSELNSPEQRELHGIKTTPVPKCWTGVTIPENDVKEYENLVYETKYMPFDDLINSYMFSYIVMNFHYTGWLQIVSRFLRKHKNISYKDFYTHLEQQIQTGNYPLLHQEYTRIRKFIVDVLGGAKNDNMVEFHSVAWHSLKPFCQNQEQLFTELFSIVDNNYCNLEPELYNDLKSLQINFMFNYNQTYPVTKSYQYNIFDYVFNDSNNLAEPHTYEFQSKFTFSNKEQFLEKVYFGRRTGIMKTLVSKNVDKH